MNWNCVYCDRPVIYVDQRWYHASNRGEYLWCTNGEGIYRDSTALQATVEDQQERLI